MWAENLLANESSLRLSWFFGSIIFLALLELLIPRRQNLYSKSFRWLNNFSLTFINTAIIRIIFVSAAIQVAATAASNHWGLLNAFPLPNSIHIIISFLFLDMCIYWQHRIFHRIPLLWRLHRVHHIDRDFDVSLSSRFHTIEIVLSMLIKMSLAIAFGLHPAGVLLFEITLNTSSNFNHANIYIPEKLDKWLQKIIVTPDMHRIHHSDFHKQTDSNFSFCISLWDRLFGTYTVVPFDENPKITIGLKEYTDPQENRIDRMLINPFKN